jgi:excisionase family DNA binding protein
VALWESDTGETLPTINQLDLLARSYGITIDALVHGSTGRGNLGAPVPVRPTCRRVSDPGPSELPATPGEPSQPAYVRLLLSPRNAADALDVSRGTIYTLMKAGKLKYVLVGADRRIPISELERLVANGMERQEGSA